MDDTNNVLLFTVRFEMREIERVTETQPFYQPDRKRRQTIVQSPHLCDIFKSSIFIFLFSFHSLFCCWLSAFIPIQSFLFGLNHHVLHYHILGFMRVWCDLFHQNMRNYLKRTTKCLSFSNALLVLPDQMNKFQALPRCLIVQMELDLVFYATKAAESNSTKLIDLLKW